MTDWAAIETDIIKALEKIRDNWPRMIHTLTAGEKPEGGGGGQTSAPTPVPASVLSLRRQVDERLAALVRAVRSENDVESRPATAATADVITWLLRWANWLSAQDWITEPKALPELTKLANRCKETAHGYTVRRYPVSTCPEQVPTDEGFTPCGATLWALIRYDHDPTPSKLRCDGTTRHEWKQDAWDALHDRLTGRQESHIQAGYQRLMQRLSI